MIKTKKIVLILILICLSSFVLAEDVLNTKPGSSLGGDTWCGNDICESPIETRSNCAEDCTPGGLEQGELMENCGNGICEDPETPERCCDDCGGCFEEVKRAGDEIAEENEKKSFFRKIIDFFKKLFAKEKKCPNGICDDLEMREGACPQDCKGIKGWGEKTELPEEEIKTETKVVDKEMTTEGSVCGDGICEPSEKAEDTCCEDCKEGGCGGNVNVNLENCGDGVCDDWTETSSNCPQDCGYDGVEIVDAEDEFKEDYDRIMAEMKDILPEVPEKEKLLDISSFYTPSATCYFSAGASLVNYMESISYDEFIWYGRPLHFQYDTRWDTLRTGVGGGELTFESFHNLGYKSYVGRTTKTYLPTPERLHMQASRNFIFFDTKEEALGFVKKLISANIPVMINLQVGRTPDYLFIKGYDETHIFIPPYVDSNGEYILSDETSSFSEEAIENKDTQSLTYAKFFSLWEGTGNTFYWIVKNNESKTEQEIFEINKKDAEEADDNVQKFINNPDFKTHTSGEDLITATAAASRYLTKQGYAELGNKYMELAKLYDEKRSQWENVGLYSQTAELYKEAKELW